MIEYHRLESKEEGKPRAVRVITDDKNAELSMLTDTLDESDSNEMVAYKNLREARLVNDKCEFIVPGDEVGEFSDLIWDIDGGKLEGLIEKWNEEMISELDES